MSGMTRAEFVSEVARQATLLPYAGTSGWSGSDTSRERAVRDDSDGMTSRRQASVVELLAAAGEAGLTWKEVSVITAWHHGQASGVLSVLHKGGRITRLATVRRDRCAVYVLPGFVAGREVSQHGRSRNEAYWREEIAQEIEQFCDANHYDKPFVPCECQATAMRVRGL